MNASLTFNTLKYLEKLKKGGIKSPEAEAITKATEEAFEEVLAVKDLATKRDIKELELTSKKEMNEIKVELIKYMYENNWRLLGMITVINGISITAMTIAFKYLFG